MCRKEICDEKAKIRSSAKIKYEKYLMQIVPHFQIEKKNKKFYDKIIKNDKFSYKNFKNLL